MNLPNVRGLFAHYVRYHRHGPLMLRYASMLGFTAIPLFYLLRFTKAEPGYDDWWIRAIVAILSITAFLQPRWPERLKPFYHPYSYLLLIVGLPGMLVFLSLHHGGGPIAVANTMMAAAFVMLLADWRNMIVIILSGMAFGTLLYLVTAPIPQMPVEYVARLPILLVTLLGGSLIKHALEQATAKRVRQAYASLAGSIAHEMRNPLGQLKYSLEAIQQALPMPTARPQEQALAPEKLDAIYHHVAQGELAVQRGLQVITMTLDEVQGKAVRTEGFQLLRAGEVCAKAVAEYGYEDASQRERVVLHVSGDFVFRGDETAFLFVLFNLIKNALVYPKLRVRIKVESGRVQVMDDGPGIAPQVLARLFEPFHSSGKKGGTGLGLAYCQRVMRSFGGSIDCASVQDQYTCFTMRFPPVSQVDSPALQDTLMARARRVLEGQRVLLVDNEATLRAATRHKLAPTGAIVDECADGEEALAMLSRSRYDLVILDLNMPGLDGYATTERIRAGHAGIDPGLRVVGLSSEPAALTRIKARKVGMNDLVAKPTEQVVLLHTLCHVLKSPSIGSTESRRPLSGHAVLLVDDNAYNRRAVAAYLRAGGAEVTEAESGAESLRRLKGMDRCDAILLDIEMPGMDGLETARAIRASNIACREAPIVALTAHAGADMRQAARDAGMNDLMLKPVDRDMLYEMLGGLDAQRTPVLKAAVPVPTGVGLLDVPRLERHRRIGLLEELVVAYWPTVDRLLGETEAALNAGDLRAAASAMHSLVGMSGEAGVQVLYVRARDLYEPMVADKLWPDGVDWIGELRRLALDSHRALRDYASASRVVV